MSKPAVVVIVGPSGVGKSTLVAHMARAFALKMAVHEPKRIGELFAPTVDWAELDCLAIDEVGQWDTASLVRNFRKLEADAVSLGKTILLILQDSKELENLGIVPTAEPALLELDGKLGTAKYSYQGQQFPYPQHLA